MGVMLRSRCHGWKSSAKNNAFHTGVDLPERISFAAEWCDNFEFFRDWETVKHALNIAEPLRAAVSILGPMETYP